MTTNQENALVLFVLVVSPGEMEEGEGLSQACSSKDIIHPRLCSYFVQGWRSEWWREGEREGMSEFSILLS